MTSFIEYVVRKLATYPDEVLVLRKEEGDLIEFRLLLNPEDVGKIIGKYGRTIQAMRTLLSATAAKTSKRVALEIDQPGSSTPA